MHANNTPIVHYEVEIYTSSSAEKVGKMFVTSLGHATASFTKIPSGNYDIVIKVFEDGKVVRTYPYYNIVFALEQGTHVSVIIPVPNPVGEKFYLCPKGGGICK